MMNVLITEPAEIDIEQLWLYIATESYPKYADEFVEKLFLQFELLSYNPELGVKRPEIGNEIRLYPVDSVNLIYRIIMQELQVLSVHHSALNSNQLQF